MVLLGHNELSHLWFGTLDNGLVCEQHNSDPMRIGYSAFQFADTLKFILVAVG